MKSTMEGGNGVLYLKWENYSRLYSYGHIARLLQRTIALHPQQPSLISQDSPSIAFKSQHNIKQSHK